MWCGFAHAFAAHWSPLAASRCKGQAFQVQRCWYLSIQLPSSRSQRLTSAVQETLRMHPALWTRCSCHVVRCTPALARKAPRSPGCFSKPQLLYGTYDRGTPYRFLGSLSLRRPYSLPATPSIRSSYSASNHYCTRQFSWIPGFNRRSDDTQQHASREGQEEAAKAAILEKAMKGRQPTDLMLRCELFPNS